MRQLVRMSMLRQVSGAIVTAALVAGFAGSANAMNGFRSENLENVTMAQFGGDFAIEGYLRDVYRIG